MSDKITLLKQRYALEQRIRTLRNPELTEGKNVSGLLAKMTAMLEHVNAEIAEMGLPQDQINSPMPMNDKPKPQEIPVSEYDSHPDHEVQMARSDLYRAAKCAISLEKMLKNISEEQGLEGWVQAKITKASDYLESVYHYMDYEMRSEVDEASFGPRTATMRPGNPPPQAPGAPKQNPNQMAPGQQSAAPKSGGSSSAQNGTGQVAMAQFDPNGKMIGGPLMVNQEDVEGKIKGGYRPLKESRRGSMEEKKAELFSDNVIYRLDRTNPMDDTEVLVIGGSGRYDFKTLRNKASREADQLASDLQAGDGQSFRKSARNIKQLANTLNTIVAAYDQLNAIRSKGGSKARGITVSELDKQQSLGRIGESKEEKKIAYCSQCSKGFSNTNVDAKYKTGFSHCKDHKGMKIVAEDASGGASSSGGMASSMGSGDGFENGFKYGGPGSIMRRKPKKKPVAEAGTEKEQGPKFTGYWKGKDKDKPGHW